MKIIDPSIEILTSVNEEEILKILEKCGRTCYKSEDKINENSSKTFVLKIIHSGHEAVIEHYNITVKFICDRGVSHEIVRHRLASYCQESTRYCNYSQDKFGKEITVIKPLFFKENDQNFILWRAACQTAENFYFSLISRKATPQEARTVLPNSLKTELVMTANIREWRHFFQQRTSKAAHPQMRQIAIMALNQFKEKMPILFGDIEVEE